MRAAEIIVAHLVFMALTTLAYGSVVGITTSSLAKGFVAEPYSATINASGGCTPYKWSIKSGSLPAGLSVEESSSTKSYVISGTPTTGETSTFMVEVVGCGGHVSTQSYSLEIQSNYSVTLSWNAPTSSEITGYNV
jgi:Putative Ig domain